MVSRAGEIKGLKIGAKQTAWTEKRRARRKILCG
jgi:hypothetical protein